jgi:uncharacterized damage-inducible protein DinB
MTPTFDRPAPSEYGQWYAGYIGGVPDGDLIRRLEEQEASTQALIAGLADSRGDHAYAPGKWTVKEVLGHVADAERVFAYRVLRIARGDTMPLAGFDEKAWVPNAGSGARTLADLAAELRAVRAATLALLRHLPAEAVGRIGTASNYPVTVRALAWIIAGHERHHLGILQERYLS